MSAKYLFGIFECRHMHIGSFVSEMLAAGHEFIGIFDEDPYLSGPLAQKHGVPLFASQTEFFARRPEIVGTSAINDRKIGIVERCAAAGIHVMADKPLALNEDGLRRLERVCAEDRIQVGLMLTERFVPLILGLKNMIAAGRFGELISFHFSKPHKLNEAVRQPWHFSREQNGGLIIDLLIHDLDLFRWFTGDEPEGFRGYLKKTGYGKYPDFFDSAQIACRSSGGVTAQMEADWRMPDGYRTWGDSRIFCTGTGGKAKLRLSGDERSPDPAGYFLPADSGAPEPVQPECPARNLTQDFLDRIEGKSNCIITKNDILDSSRAAIEADRAAEIIR